MESSNSISTSNLPTLTVNSPTSPMSNRAEELKKAQNKLSAGGNHSSSNGTTPRKHRNSLSAYPIIQEEDEKEIFDRTSSMIQRELSNPTFKKPVKAFEKWANQLTSNQLVTLCCILFKQIEASQLQTIQDLLKHCQKEPAFYFGTLTSELNEEQANKEVVDEAISELMNTLSIVQPQKSKIADNPFRKSLPVTFDLPLNKPRYEPFSDDIPEDPSQSSFLFNPRRKSYNDENFNSLNGGDWLTPQNRTLSPIPPTSPITPTISNRVRPKSMFEPGLPSNIWQNDASFNMDQSKIINDKNIWSNNPPNQFNNQHNGNPNGISNGKNTTPFSTQIYTDPIRAQNALSIVVHPDQYMTPSAYSPSIPTINPYNQNNNVTSNQSILVPNNVPVSPFSPSNWMGFKDKNKRRSHGDNEFFSQGAKSMFSNIPNTFRKHLMKPHNKVDFDLLQDIPAWLRSLRLHKYTDSFEGMVWQDIIKLTDEELSAKGISALGARRKMLKHFELVKQELQNLNKVK